VLPALFSVSVIRWLLAYIALFFHDFSPPASGQAGQPGDREHWKMVLAAFSMQIHRKMHHRLCSDALFWLI
jgi:hypothetical protein